MNEEVIVFLLLMFTAFVLGGVLTSIVDEDRLAEKCLISQVVEMDGKNFKCEIIK